MKETSSRFQNQTRGISETDYCLLQYCSDINVPIKSHRFKRIVVLV